MVGHSQDGGKIQLLPATAAHLEALLAPNGYFFPMYRESPSAYVCVYRLHATSK